MNMIGGRMEAADARGAHVSAAGPYACSFQSTRAEPHQAPKSFSAYGPSIYTGAQQTSALEATVVAVERLGSEKPAAREAGDGGVGDLARDRQR